MLYGELEDFKKEVENHIELDKRKDDDFYLRYCFKKPVQFILDYGKAVITVNRLDIELTPRTNLIFVDFQIKRLILFIMHT